MHSHYHLRLSTFTAPNSRYFAAERALARAHGTPQTAITLEDNDDNDISNLVQNDDNNISNKRGKKRKMKFQTQQEKEPNKKRMKISNASLVVLNFMDCCFML